MTMILQLLVAAVAVGLGVGVKLGIPPYKLYVQEVEEAAETLEKNMLSMQGNVPLLNDFRRHYAEIVNVVNYMGIKESGCALVDYYEFYPKMLNNSAPQAINHPEEVVDEIKNSLVDVHSKIQQLKELINGCEQEPWPCNIFIDKIIKEEPDQYGQPAALLIAAGLAATELRILNGKFEEVSKDLKAHQYVITSPKELEPIVWAVADVHRKARDMDKC